MPKGEWLKAPSLTRLNEVLFLDIREGTLFWRVNLGSRAKAGERADRYNVTQGYYVVNLDGVRYKAHLLIWFMLHGEWCPRGIDHADRDRGNNRPTNLRKATESQQRQNKGRQSNNTSGVIGVSWQAKLGKWEAAVVKDRIRVYRAYFDTLEEAEMAVRRERAKHHGEFAVDHIRLGGLPGDGSVSK